MFRGAAAALLLRCLRPRPIPTRHLFSATTSLQSRTSNPTPTEKEDPSRIRDPPPIRVSLTESAGRGVFATRRIRAGETIHTAQPLVAHPSASLLTEVTELSQHSTLHLLFPSIESITLFLLMIWCGVQVCYYCLRRLGGRSGSGDGDSGGGGVRFCCERCKEESKVFYEVEKRADWSAFDYYCKTRRLKYPLLVKRLACMVICGTTSATTFEILQPATLSSHAIQQMEEEFEILTSALSKAQLDDKYTAFLTKSWYVGVLARIRINAFRVDITVGSYEDLVDIAAASVACEAAVGNAVYMLPSFYNHDCGIFSLLV